MATSPAPPCNNNSGRPYLLGLPVEIYTIIGTYLTQPQAMDVSLTCHALRAVFRPSAWRAILVRGEPGELHPRLCALVDRIKREVEEEQNGTLPYESLARHVKSLKVSLPYHYGPLDGWSSYYHSGFRSNLSDQLGICDRLMELISLLGQIRELDLDLTDMHGWQVHHMIKLLWASAPGILSQVRRVKLVSGRSRPRDLALHQYLNMAFCTVLGPKADDLECTGHFMPLYLWYGPPRTGLQSAFDTLNAFTNPRPDGTPSRSLRHLRLGNMWNCDETLSTCQVLEWVVGPHKNTIETIFLKPMGSFFPVQDMARWKTRRQAVDNIVNALSDMPRLRRIAFPALELVRINDMGEGAFQFAKAITEDVMKRLPHVEYLVIYTRAWTWGVMESYRAEGKICFDFGFGYSRISEKFLQTQY
ncbi:hypothetical protein QBC41DRAFT_397663 [Cercophora samala]|uniref:F-box domain-containing protein n=1 Tax=Cercophora samala TaxID=330535 RepID=A0AA39Z9B8_9PEZI|nr:hypothetical protein QBC41DRAFT_397663 [Cercophora samala]